MTILTVFSLFWLHILNLPALLQKKKIHGLDRYHGHGPSAKSRPSKNQSESTDLPKTGFVM